jgi:hypothetical protein
LAELAAGERPGFAEIGFILESFTSSSSTLNQGVGGRTVEAEVPYGGVVVNRLSTLYAGKESIHQDELRHLGRNCAA